MRSNPNSHVSQSIATHRDLLNGFLGSDIVDAAIEQLMNANVDQDWIFAAGLVNPNGDPAELERINVEAPLRLLEHLSRGGLGKERRLITFGSVLENRPDLIAANPYLRSKARLLDFWRQRDPRSPVRWVHIQLHTLYGGSQPPHPFMFTGQMLSALTTRSPFRMSSGVQLREYHHVDDISASILGVLASPIKESARLDLSSGEGIRLRDLAWAVFDHFGSLDLLRIGAWPAGDAEVFESAHHRSPLLIAYREPLPNVIAWFEDLGLH